MILRGRALPDTVLCGSMRKMDLDVDAVLFDFNSYIITPPGMKALDKLCAELRQNKFKTIHVIGYTDQTGSDAYNADLSLKRAQSITAYLKQKMHDPNISFHSEGRGATHLVSGTDKQVNRRVEIYIE